MFNVWAGKVIESNRVIGSNRWQCNSNRFENLKCNSNRLLCNSNRFEILKCNSNRLQCNSNGFENFKCNSNSLQCNSNRQHLIDPIPDIKQSIFFLNFLVFSPLLQYLFFLLSGLMFPQKLLPRIFLYSIFILQFLNIFFCSSTLIVHEVFS